MRRWHTLKLLSVHTALSVTLSACWSNHESTEATETPDTPVASAETEAAKPAEPETPDPCIENPKLPHEPPTFLRSAGIMVTRISQSCTTRSGKKGYLRDANWRAMGFPCTGGAGHVDVQGYQAQPKAVSFIISLDCSMDPASPNRINELAKEELGLSGEPKLSAFYPFVVQYWELGEAHESDVGFSVDLRSKDGLGLWPKFQKNTPIDLKLYGREHTWAVGEEDHLYEVKGQLVRNGDSFKLLVLDAHALNEEEISRTRDRCDALKPARSCADVFGSGKL